MGLINQPKYFNRVESEIINMVKDDVPDIDQTYLKFKKLSDKREFLKEILLEYLIQTFVSIYKKKNKTIEDYISDHEKSADRYKENYPEVVTSLLRCIENPNRYEPTFSTNVEKGISRKINTTSDDTAAMSIKEEENIDEDLRKWFGRKGAPGKKKGWVDCNTCRKDKKTGRKKCSACGRSSGEKRSKYPACRPTPSACGKRGKWGKKSKAKSGKKESLSMDLDQIIMQELMSVLDEKKKKKKKKKKSSGKKDACYHKVKARYSVWPSAYASGALVKCRKVGAANWGNSKKESLQIMIEDELSQVLLEKKDNLKHKVVKALKDEGGAAGMGALVKHTKASKAEIQKVVDAAKNIKVHKDGDIILMDSLDEKDDVRDTYDDEVVKRNKKKRDKLSRAMGLSENREEIAQIARELIAGEINEADAIQFLTQMGKERAWAQSWVTLVKSNPGMFSEAKKKKKKSAKDRMKCNSPRRISKGQPGHGKKKFVVKACDGGQEKIIRYGDANMEIKKDSPARRKSFRARHNCKNPGSKLKARYWSCKKW